MEEARTIITLYRYNEMRECEDIQVIQLWIALQDFTSFVTSFQISQLHNQFPNQLQRKQPLGISTVSTSQYTKYHTVQATAAILTTTYYYAFGKYNVLRSRSAHRAMLQYSTCYVLHHYPYIMYILPNIRYRYVSLHLQRDTTCYYICRHLQPQSVASSLTVGQRLLQPLKYNACTETYYVRYVQRLLLHTYLYVCSHE